MLNYFSVTNPFSVTGTFLGRSSARVAHLQFSSKLLYSINICALQLSVLLTKRSDSNIMVDNQVIENLLAVRMYVFMPSLGVSISSCLHAQEKQSTYTVSCF